MFKRKPQEEYSTQKAVKQNDASSPSSITILQEYFLSTSDETEEPSQQITPDSPTYSELNLSSIEEDGDNILIMPALTSAAYINETSEEMEPSTPRIEYYTSFFSTSEQITPDESISSLATLSATYNNETSRAIELSSNLSSPRDSLDGIDFSLLNFEEEAMISGRFVYLDNSI
jgi:hypothetical protein